MWRDTLAMPPEQNILPLNLGVDSEGRLFRDDFTKCPHLLVGGSTGGGKSIWLTGVIASLMYWRSPQQVQFILSDTKTVEFTNFVGSPHITGTIAHTMYETWDKMDWIIDKMEERLVMLGKAGYRDVAAYNSRNLTQQLPYYVLVIDELFDILGGSERGEGKIATDKLARIVAKSRAAGCHVLAATQRSSVDVVSGRVKTNFPSRLTFRLPNESDSRTIINIGGAEHLMPWGDMLYTGPASTAVKRLHSAFTELSDVQQAVALGKMKASMAG
jgi:S-DNA-T family DNA segregation ATPase FtsK/SpoIIIE